MSLPSQTARAGGGRGSAVYSRQRRKGPFRAVLPFGILAVLIAIVWFAMRPTGETPKETAAGEQPAPVEQAPVAGNKPVEISQNRRSDNGGAGNGVQSPPRTLPGTREPAADEIDRAVGNERADPPTLPATTGGTGSSGTDGGVLTRALEEKTAARPQTNSPEATQPPASTGNTGNAGMGRVRLQIDTARRLVSENDRVGARALLSRVLRDPGLSEAEANLLRDELTTINESLVFGRTLEPGDAMTEEYEVQPGDSLAKIASRRELAVHWKLIQRINGLSDPTKIRVGQKLKLVRGPFHAVVDKSDYRLDVWQGPPSDPARWVYIRSFDVGLGADDGTPLGTFVVSPNKLENPGWVNPRDSRDRYEPNDPKNPIGEYWVGLDGIGNSQGVTGYGIHGTIDPGSVGQNKSMGCVRLRDADIALVYELLAERVSRVDIVP